MENMTSYFFKLVLSFFTKLKHISICPNLQITDCPEGELYLYVQPINLIFLFFSLFRVCNIMLFLIMLLLSPVTIGSPLDKWEELNSNSERNGNRKWKLERRRSSKNSSNEFLW